MAPAALAAPRRAATGAKRREVGRAAHDRRRSGATRPRPERDAGGSSRSSRSRGRRARRSRARAARWPRAAARRPPKRERNSSGTRSWWSKTKRAPRSFRGSATRNSRSGGLQACTTSKGRSRSSLSASRSECQSAVAVLAHVARWPAGGRLQRVAVDLDALDARVRLGVAPGPSRADHRDLVARLDECPALLPDAPVERHARGSRRGSGCAPSRRSHQAAPR